MGRKFVNSSNLSLRIGEFCMFYDSFDFVNHLAEGLSSPVKIINTLKNVNNIIDEIVFLFKYFNNKKIVLI